MINSSLLQEWLGGWGFKSHVGSSGQVFLESCFRSSGTFSCLASAHKCQLPLSYCDKEHVCPQTCTVFPEGRRHGSRTKLSRVPTGPRKERKLGHKEAD